VKYSLLHAFNNTESPLNETASTFTNNSTITIENITEQINNSVIIPFTPFTKLYTENHSANTTVGDEPYTYDNQILNTSSISYTVNTTDYTFLTTQSKLHPNNTAPIYSLKEYTFHIDVHFFSRYWKIFFVIFTIILFAVACIVFHFVHRKKFYESVEQEEDIPYNYIYKPAQIGYIDDEYENTFVGVSIPLLQDVTKV